jgi:hypothetical protein
METSALVDGRLVEVYRNGLYVREFSRNRAWIVRDLLLDRDIGLGNRLSASIWDNASGLRAAQHYEETVTNFDDEQEQRDYCDVIINERRSGWDHLKNLLFEGRAILIPSSGKFKYVLDIDKEPALLHSSPGNIIEDSLRVETGSAEPPINTIRAEFPNIENDYAVVPAKLVSSDIGDDPERPEEMSFTSIVRKSQVSREMNFRLKKLTQIRKRWTWKSPRNAVTSEPFDIDKIAYRTPKHLRGYTGFINGDDSNTTSISTGKEIFLESGESYSIHVRQHSTVEERDLTNATGMTHVIMTFTTPLSFTPKVGDIWAVGKIANMIESVQIDDVEFDGENFTMKAHQHIPAIYTDTLSDVTALENAVDVNTNYPPPVLDAQAFNFVDGAGITTGYYFNVVPNYTYLAGTYSFLGTNTIILESDEAAIDDFFNNGYVEADLDPPLRIADYDGSTRTATIEGSFIAASSQGGPYYISWPIFTNFYGFSVEGSNNGISWSDIGDTVGTTLTVLTASTFSQFRFFPYGTNEVENTTVAVTVSEGRFDEIAPSPPLKVTLTTDANRTGFVNVELDAPVERDLQYLNTIFETDLTTGNTSWEVLTDISDYRDDRTTISPLIITVTRDLSGFPFGATVSAHVATMDFFGNKSAYVYSDNDSLSASEDDAPIDIPIEIEPDTLPEGAVTGCTITSLFSQTIDGGTLGTNHSIDLALNLLVTPGSTASTFLTFHFMYGGASVSAITAQISDNSSAIPDDTQYQLSYRLDALNSSESQQFGTTKKIGTEIPSNDIRTATGIIGINSNIDQDLEVKVSASGDCTTQIEVISAVLKQLIDGSDATSTGELYIIAGTVPGIPTTDFVSIHPVTMTVDFDTNLPTSKGYCDTVSTSTADFSLKKNGVEFGQMRFLTGTNTATFIATATQFASGDIFTITPPNPADATLQNIGWSIRGVRS